MNKIFLMILAFFLSLNTVFAQDLPEEHKTFYAKGVVQELEVDNKNDELDSAFMSQQIRQILGVKILTSELKGQSVQVENYLSNNPLYDIDVKKGDRVLLEIDEDADSYTVNVAAKDRSPVLMTVLGIFFLSLLLVGGYKGFNSLISILITAGLVFFVLIPAFLSGYSPIPITIAIAVLSTFLTMFIVGGINTKSLAASLGTVISLGAAGGLSMLVIHMASLKGLYSHEAMVLWSSMPELNFKGILTSAMIIAALGAAMDVGMSIASCINEVNNSCKDFDFHKLFKSGMNVGKDIIGTMSNTLIFAYLGGSMPLLLLSVNIPFDKFVNLNSVTTEILAALIGTIAIVACVPITALITAYLITSKKIKH